MEQHPRSFNIQHSTFNTQHSSFHHVRPRGAETAPSQPARRQRSDRYPYARELACPSPAIATPTEFFVVAFTRYMAASACRIRSSFCVPWVGNVAMPKLALMEMSIPSPRWKGDAVIDL